MKLKKHKMPSILFIDSGIGGLSTLSETMKILKVNYIYFADNEFAPYGSKSDLSLRERLSLIISQTIQKYSISMVVLACNTATTSSVNFLRKKFPTLTFVGTEPACKLASDNNFNNPIVIATPRTISHIINPKIKAISCPELASLIENKYIQNSPKSNLLLLKQLYLLKQQIQDYDCLILGCTHYSFIKHQLIKMINVPIFDGNHGVSKQIARLCNQKLAKFPTCKIILSRYNSITLQKYKKILNQILANQINLC